MIAPAVENTPTRTATAADAPATGLQDGDTILYFGNDWAAENRTSSHHYARQLAKRFRVFYIECPGWRTPKGNARDLKKVFAKVWKFLCGTRDTPEGVKLRTLFQFPFHRFGLVRAVNRLIVKATVRLMMWRHGVRRPLTWFHVPHVPYLANALGERLAVYYCIDDYSAYPGVNPDVVRAMDEETTKRADVVFVASETLEERKKALNPRTVVSPHGVEFEHFARAQDATLAIPNDIAHLTGPVVGYFGLIESFTDLSLIDWLAEQRPDWQFVLLGRVAVPEADVPKRANVHFLGQRPYATLPAYAKRFDVCVMPYRAGEWSRHANPIKLREYLATGKPVVSIDIPQARKFADVIGIAATRDEFLSRLDDAIRNDGDESATRRRMDRVVGSSWAARTAEVVEVISREITERG